MEMIVYAPRVSSCGYWAMDGSVQVKSWSAPVEVRTGIGEIRIDDLKSDTVSLLCPSCPISAKGIRGYLRCMGGSGEVVLDRRERRAGLRRNDERQSAHSRVDPGEQLYVAKAGNLSAAICAGASSSTRSTGRWRCVDSSGFVSGRTEQGRYQRANARMAFLTRRSSSR